MTCPTSPRFNPARRAAPASVALLLVLTAACQSAESKRMQELAGNYVSTYESETLPGEREPWIVETNTLSLRADGRWTLNVARTVNGKADHVNADSGAYRVDGTTLAMGATEAGPPARYTISGDTLWSMDSGQRALAERVTGVKATEPAEQSFYVRQR